MTVSDWVEFARESLAFGMLAGLCMGIAATLVFQLIWDASDTLGAGPEPRA